MQKGAQALKARKIRVCNERLLDKMVPKQPTADNYFCRFQRCSLVWIGFLGLAKLSLGFGNTTSVRNGNTPPSVLLTNPFGHFASPLRTIGLHWALILFTERDKAARSLRDAIALAALQT